MFAPLRTFRRWHRRVNVTQKRHAIASAIAASAVVPLVYARGHEIHNIPELPLVVDDKINNYEKTKEVIGFFKRIGAYEDYKRSMKTPHEQAGRGHHYSFKKGPLFVYSDENVKLLKAVRNLQGVDICNVNRLNLLQLAPGGHLGRFIIWTASAFKALNSLFGTHRYGALEKADYHLNRPVLSNADIARIINSNEI
jgi:large subunit ribosomal protein L4e